jgi:hypothetical protein
MTHAVIDRNLGARRIPWSWRWFAIGSSTTVEFLVLGALIWAWAGQWWIGGAVVLAVIAAIGGLAHQGGRGRLPAYLIGIVAALVVSYGAISVAVGVYLQPYYH